MGKAGGSGGDVLGLLAFGSVIGNVVQASDKLKLRRMYDHVVTRYRQLEGEYAALRGLNEQLQRQIVELRDENNRLHAELAKKSAVAAS